MLKKVVVRIGLASALLLAAFAPPVQQTCPYGAVHTITVTPDTPDFQFWRILSWDWGATTEAEQWWSSYNSGTDSVVVYDDNATPITTTGTGYFNNYDAFTYGMSETNGTIEDVVHIGEYILRRNTYGDIYTTGWFGSDEMDQGTYQIPVYRGDWIKINAWAPNVAHQGAIGRLDNDMFARTAFFDIGAGSSGNMTPSLRTVLTIRNINGTTTDTGNVQYSHRLGEVYNWQVGAQAGYTARDGAGAGISASAGGSYEISDPNVVVFVYPRVDVSGQAWSQAEADIDNTFEMFLSINDTLACWFMRTVNNPGETALNVP